MAERENIVLRLSDSHEFSYEDVGMYKIVAHIPNSDYTIKENIFDTRNIKVLNPTPIGDITPSTTPANAFITGTDTEYLSILYSLTPEYDYTIDELNEAAYIYINDWNNVNDNEIPINTTQDEKPIYFGADSNGIFSLLDIGDVPIERYNPNNIYINKSNKYIKAYVKGTCSIIDVDYSDTNNLNFVPSIAYPLTFNDENGYMVPYLFINSNIQLLSGIQQEQDKGILRFTGSSATHKYFKCSYESRLYIDNTLSYFKKEQVNYILKFAIHNQSNYKINTINSAASGKIAMMIKNGTIRSLIIPETVKKISNFCGASNSTNIVLPNSLVEIGTAAFNGISGGTISLRSYNNNLKIIGDYAFANTGNVRFFEYDIDEDKATIIENLCPENGSNDSLLFLDKEQLSNVLDTLSLNSAKLICLIPRVEKIGNYAFYNAKNSTSISNIILPNTITSVGMCAFSRAGINNLVIPKQIVARPKSSSTPNIIYNSELLYLPDKAIAIACSQGNGIKTVSKSYTSLMKDEIQYEYYNRNGYEYDFDLITDGEPHLVNSWLANKDSNNKLIFEKYKTISINKSTFESLSTNPHFYFIDTEPEMLT